MNVRNEKVESILSEVFLGTYTLVWCKLRVKRLKLNIERLQARSKYFENTVTPKAIGILFS